MKKIRIACQRVGLHGWGGVNHHSLLYGNGRSNKNSGIWSVAWCSQDKESCCTIYNRNSQSSVFVCLAPCSCCWCCCCGFNQSRLVEAKVADLKEVSITYATFLGSNSLCFPFKNIIIVFWIQNLQELIENVERKSPISRHWWIHRMVYKISWFTY